MKRSERETAKVPLHSCYLFTSLLKCEGAVLHLSDLQTSHVVMSKQCRNDWRHLRMRAAARLLQLDIRLSNSSCLSQPLLSIPNPLLYIRNVIPTLEIQTQKPQGAVKRVSTFLRCFRFSCVIQEVESVLGESEQERKDIRDKYIALGEKVELLLHQEERVKSNADRDTEAAKMAVKEAVLDLEMVCRPDLARKEKKRKDYAFRHHFDEKPSVILGCPARPCNYVT